METETDKTWDVVIYKLEDSKVASVIGTRMEMARDGGGCATKRRQTGRSRINELYEAAIVPSGVYKKGSIISSDDLEFSNMLA